MSVNIKKKKMKRKEIVKVLQKTIKYLIGLDQPDKKSIIWMWFHLKDLLEILERAGKKKFEADEREVQHYIKRLNGSGNGKKKK